MFESDIEKFVIELLRKEGYKYLSPEALAKEREQLDEVVLISRLRKAVEDLNHDANETVRERAIKEVLELNKPGVANNNEDFLPNAHWRVLVLRWQRVDIFGVRLCIL